jgi:hypothetical protein
MIQEFAKLYEFARFVCLCPIGQRYMRIKTIDLVAQIQEHFPNIEANLSHASFQYGSKKAQKSLSEI